MGARSDCAAGCLQARRMKRRTCCGSYSPQKADARSEQITEEQLALFEAELKAQGVNVEDLSKGNDAGNGPDEKNPPASSGNTETNPRGRRALPAHLKRERIVHDLGEAEKHCAICAQDLREFGEETSERYEYIPPQLIVMKMFAKSFLCLHGEDCGQAFAAQ